MSVNNNENKKVIKASKKGRFNLIDFLIILIVLLLIAATVYVFLPSSWVRDLMSDETTSIQYAIEIKGVDAQFLNSIKENDIVLDSVTKSNIGTVTAVDYSTQYTELKYNESTKTGVLSVIPDKYNIIVTISASGDFTEKSGYSINGTRIAVGEKLNVRFPSYVCEGYCISVPVN